jgi:hypothetical protein
MEEFDAINYVKSIRNLKMMVSSMMDDSERYLVRYQKTHVLDYDSDKSESEDGETFKDIPGMFAKPHEKEKHKMEVTEFMVSKN